MRTISDHGEPAMSADIFDVADLASSKLPPMAVRSLDLPIPDLPACRVRLASGPVYTVRFFPHSPGVGVHRGWELSVLRAYRQDRCVGMAQAEFIPRHAFVQTCPSLPYFLNVFTGVRLWDQRDPNPNYWPGVIAHSCPQEGALSAHLQARLLHPAHDRLVVRHGREMLDFSLRHVDRPILDTVGVADFPEWDLSPQDIAAGGPQAAEHNGLDLAERREMADMMTLLMARWMAMAGLALVFRHVPGGSPIEAALATIHTASTGPLSGLRASIHIEADRPLPLKPSDSASHLSVLDVRHPDDAAWHDAARHTAYSQQIAAWRAFCAAARRKEHRLRVIGPYIRPPKRRTVPGMTFLD